MTSALIALALILAGAFLTRSVYQLGMTAGVRLGYGYGRSEAYSEARRLIQQGADALTNGSETNGN